MIKSPENLNVRTATQQLLRYAVVGIANNSGGYLVYLMLTYFGSSPKLTMTLLYVTGAAIGYAGNRKFTFAHQGSALSSSMRYVIAHFCGYLVNLLILIVFADYLGYAHYWVQSAAIFFVAGFLFVIFKFFVFRGTDPMKINKP